MQKILDYFKVWKERLGSETPNFFKTIIRASVLLGSVGLALIAVGDSIPAPLKTIAGYLVAIGAVGGVIAKSAKVDTEDKKKIK